MKRHSALRWMEHLLISRSTKGWSCCILTRVYSRTSQGFRESFTRLLSGERKWPVKALIAGRGGSAHFVLCLYGASARFSRPMHTELCSSWSLHSQAVQALDVRVQFQPRGPNAAWPTLFPLACPPLPVPKLRSCMLHKLKVNEKFCPVDIEPRAAGTSGPVWLRGLVSSCLSELAWNLGGICKRFRKGACLSGQPWSSTIHPARVQISTEKRIQRQ